jgi:tRNA dimethylallyltransferase
MRQIVSPKIIVVLGPTASGKSALAIELARRFHGEIVSADSRQVYRGLDLGTGKVTKKEMRGVPHHLLDVASPRRAFTVAQYQKKAEAAIQRILRKGKVPILCGGTGFYIDAVLYGFLLPPVPPNERLREELERKSTDELFNDLDLKDPARAGTIDRKNRRRLIRALEIIHATGRPIPLLERAAKYDSLAIGIRIPGDGLKKKIEQRLLARLRAGMIREAERLHRQGLGWARMEELGLEYRYLARHLQGHISKAEMTAQLIREIAAYAKRQITWFKRNPEIHWITEPREAFRLAQEFLAKENARQ